jgi:hypothetical protein
MALECDQEIEHMNDDFFGEGVHAYDAEPEHLFKIGSQSVRGVLAGQRGLVAQFAPNYPAINYLVKMNSKTHLVETSQDDPYSPQLYDIQTVLDLIDNGVNVVGIGHTIHLGLAWKPVPFAQVRTVESQALLQGQPCTAALRLKENDAICAGQGSCASLPGGFDREALHLIPLVAHHLGFGYRVPHQTARQRGAPDSIQCWEVKTDEIPDSRFSHQTDSYGNRRTRAEPR